MKYLLTALITLAFLSGCKKEKENFMYEYKVANPTGTILKAVNTQTGQAFQLGPGTTTIPSNLPIEAFVVQPVSASDKKYALEQIGDASFNAYSYDNDIEYRFSGTAQEAKISYINSQGQSVHADKVVLPHWVAYKDFTIKNCGMDIENLQDVGTVTVEIYFKGKLIKQATAPKRAGASANINGGTF
jgi:ABC-type uncharacterized transport system auxiliary subunit